MKYSIKSFGNYKDQEYHEIIITNDDVNISFSDFGARINQWKINNEQIILGYQDVHQAILGETYYYGATLGRVAGRIDKAEFSIDGQQYLLTKNNGDNQLHGGGGLSDKKWTYEIEETDDAITVTFEIVDQHLSDGYPGNLHIKVRHRYNVNNQWSVHYEAISDQKTIFNPSNHVYFNLNGNNTKNILNHDLWIDADAYLPVRADGVPTGEIVSVDGSAFDLRKPTRLASIVTSEDDQIILKKGLDHPFKLNGKQTPILKLVSEDNHRSISVTTDRSGVVVYTHNYADVPLDIWGNPLQVFAGVAIETQEFPDAVHHENFGSTVLKANEKFKATTTYQLAYES
ncbi:aldose epimerase family protein [Aerococcus viridans]